MMLRLIAVGIAVAGLADPMLTVSRSARPPLTVTVLDTPTLSLPYDGVTRRERAYRSAETVARELSQDFAVTVHGQPAGSTADPCPREGGCVVVSDGARPRTLDSRNRVLGGVRVGGALAPNVAIATLEAPRVVDTSALGAVDVGLEARGIGAITTTVDVFDGDVKVGSTSHAWPSDDTLEVQRASVRVEWVPLRSGARELRVVASPADGEVTLLDNEAMTSVSVNGRSEAVLVYDPQPGWGSVFVRRALEEDARFRVLLRARLGPMQTAASTDLQLTAEALEDADVRAVIVSTPQALFGSEIASLERWMRVRGGSLVLLLDRPPAGELARLIRATGESRSEAAPVAVGTLKASELIVLSGLDLAPTVLAAAGDDPVVVSIPRGRGRLIASGAIDAWRYRSEEYFASFWRSVIADAVAATGERLALTVSPPVVATGEPIEIDVEWRSVRETAPKSLTADGALRCEGARDVVVRLWPSRRYGRFRGVVDPPLAGDCVVVITLAPLGSGTAPVRVVEAAPGPLSTPDALSAAVAAHGGVVVAAGDEEALVTRLRASAPAARVSTPMRPMRSAWWILPLAAALGGEWWLRRRRGWP